jgi:hypothetical protein
MLCASFGDDRLPDANVALAGLADDHLDRHECRPS